MEKNTNAKKPFYRKWWFIAIVAFFVIGGIGSAFSGGDEAKEEETVEEKEGIQDEAKKDKATIEKEYYVNEVEPAIAKHMKLYDQIWEAVWVTTFEGIEQETVDQYEAYEKMKDLESRYGAMMDSISKIDGDKLSKDNKKELNEFKTKFKEAAMMRKAAGAEAKKMFDKGTFTPSELDKVKTNVDISNRSLIQAAVHKTTLDTTFDVAAE